MATIDQLPLLPGPLLPTDLTLVRRGGRTYRAPVPVPGESSIGGIPGLQAALDSKAAAVHDHDDATAAVAGFMSAADKGKLDGVAAGATANATDAQLRARGSHTGEQAISTVTGLQAALEARAAAGHSHGAATAAAAGFMSAADKAKLDGVAAGATANASDAQLRARGSHTGEQAISTVTGLQAALEARAAAGHSHNAATAAAAGFMSAADKAKLDGLQIGAGGAPTLTLARDLARARYLRETQGGVLQLGAVYGVWTGGGAITMYLPKRAGLALGDRIEFLNLHMTWPAQAFTIARQEVGTWFCGSRGMFDSDLVCNLRLPGFALQVAWLDASTVWWNVV